MNARAGLVLVLSFAMFGSSPFVAKAHEGYCDDDDQCMAICEAGHANTEPPHNCFRGRCPPQPIHTYAFAGLPAMDSDTLGVETTPFGSVVLQEPSILSCSSGDYSFGIGGGFFGYGPWADEPLCDYDLNVHGDHVAVEDLLFGRGVAFFMGEDDQSGPVIIPDFVSGGNICETDGNISPGDPSTDPTADGDDCLSPAYYGVGGTCGTGGGDGGYWVIIPSTYASESGLSFEQFAFPTAGTITASQV